MKRLRLLLADDHTMVLEGFRRLLEQEYELVGAVQDGRELLTVAPQLRPDIILLDISMPYVNGIEAARQLKQLLPDTKMIFLTMHTDPTYVTEAFKAGASGYVLKRSATSELVCAIEEVSQGRSYVTPLITKDLMHSIMEIIRVTETSPS